MKRKSNILKVYTLTSLFSTLVIAAVLSIVLVGNMEKKIIKAHSDFYRSFIEAIPYNYSELLPELMNLPFTSEHSELVEHNDSHDILEGSNHHQRESIWSHFQTDLLQTPSVQQFRIFNRNSDEIWKFSREKQIDLQSMISEITPGEITFHIMEQKPQYIIHYYFPIIHKEQTIGMVEITDSDQNLSEVLESSQRIIVLVILAGGLSLYLLLFILFYQAYKNQNRAITRLNKSQSLTIHTMSLLAELRDDDTGSHIIRTKNYCRALTIALKEHRTFKHYINEDYVEDMERSAPLHDIGKVGISDQVLRKPGKLTPDEFEEIKKHPILGAEVLKIAVESLDFQSYFEIGYQIVLHHHENWDGSGYPSGLKGEEIPLSARIMAIADVYDALRSERPYKSPISHEKAMDILKEDRGHKFDPRLIKVLVKIEKTFKEISLK